MQSNDQRRCVHPVEPSGELTWGVGIFQSFIMSATMEMNATRDSYSKHYDYTTGEMSNDSQGSGTDNWCVLRWVLRCWGNRTGWLCGSGWIHVNVSAGVLPLYGKGFPSSTGCTQVPPRASPPSSS
jgi:hypothetical protein